MLRLFIVYSGVGRMPAGWTQERGRFSDHGYDTTR